MNNVFKYFFLIPLLLIGLTVSSCGDEESGGDPDFCSNNSLTFTLNGTPWTASTFANTFLVAFDAAAGMEAKRVDIRATDADGNYLIVTFNNPGMDDGVTCVEEGAYVAFEDVISQNQNVFFFTYVGIDGTTTAAFEGTLNITECNASEKTVSGNFEFENDFDGFVGTNGQFSVCFLTP